MILSDAPSHGFSSPLERPLRLVPALLCTALVTALSTTLENSFTADRSRSNLSANMSRLAVILDKRPDRASLWMSAQRDI